MENAKEYPAVSEKAAAPMATHEEKVGAAAGATLADILQNDKPNPWSPGYLRLYLVCLLVYLCSTMNGN